MRQIRYQSSERGRASTGNMGGRTAQALLKKKKEALVSLRKEKPLCFRKASLWFTSSNCNGSPALVSQTLHAPDDSKRLAAGSEPSCCQEVMEDRTSNLSAASARSITKPRQTEWKPAARDVGSTEPPAHVSREAVSDNEQSKQNCGPHHYRPKVRLK